MGWKGQPEEVRPERNPVVRLLRRFMPVTKEYHGAQFVAHTDGQWQATPLLVREVRLAISQLP